MQNSVFWIRITSLYGSQTSPGDCTCETARLAPELLNLHWSQTSPVVLCMQNNMICIRITGLYWSQPSLEVFEYKTATLGPELPSLSGSQPSSVVFAFKTATLRPELQVYMDPSPHLWFVHSQQRHYDQNWSLYRSLTKSLWVSAFICGFCIQNSDIKTRIASLYGSQPSSVVCAFTTATLWPELKSL